MKLCTTFRTLIVLQCISCSVAFSSVRPGGSIVTKAPKRSAALTMAHETDGARSVAKLSIASLTTLVAPALALAEIDNDDIPYGTVEAPGWVLPVVALLTIGLTALVPILLQPGDNAAREMQERDSGFYGKTRGDDDTD